MLLRNRCAVGQTEGVNVTVTTLDGEPMSADATSIAVGSELRIAAAFRASAIDDASGVRTTVEAKYVPDAGRYVLRSVSLSAARDDVDEQELRRVSTQELVQTAVPQCIALQLDDKPDAPWMLASELSATEGRIIPEWLTAEVVKRGTSETRMETITILYGVSALAGLPPVKAVQAELGVPHRTASDWIGKARKAGYLEGMNYHVGRQHNG